MPLELSHEKLNYLYGMVRKSVLGNPSEYDSYGVITEAFILHKQPQERFTLFPQLFLPWNPNDPNDARGCLPDLGLGRYYDSVPHVRLQGGVKVKRAVAEITHLPSANDAAEIEALQTVIHTTVTQAEDQAKAAVKGGLLPGDKTLQWLIFVGPYFTCIRFGPFAGAQLQTRGHKPNDSGDWLAAIEIQRSKEKRQKYPIYLLGTSEAAAELERFLDVTAAFYI
ncbi:hypothetical protein M422DRAFT_226590 [Sphaerobolus stellatus SS14]|uniref:Uncharacterized protein n=1 Tax=Sphaerobolus stellatus (strain SS14) TaxID=990650 RepID=A0A0C9W5A4_SPHS4|nr:hypothetical protein M422DRAFT_226590 [Sphaerobolus stellatus SS14]